MQTNGQKATVFEMITSIYIVLLITAFLFFCGSGGYQEIVRYKFLGFCVISSGYCAVMGIVGIECLLVGQTKIVPILQVLTKMTWAQRFAIMYIGLTWVSAVASPYFPDTVIGVSRYEGAFTITVYILSFLLVSKFGSISTSTLYILLGAVATFGALCIVQMFGYNPFALYPEGYSYLDAYVSYPGAYLGTIGNVDLVAAFLCLVIPIMWIGIIRLQGRIRLFLAVPLIISVYVLFKMSVQAGLVGVLIGGLFSFPIIAPVSVKHKKILAVSISILCLVGIVAVYLFDTKEGVLHELHCLLNGNVDDSFGSGRIQIWRSVLKRVPSQLWFGSGPDTMYYAQLQPFTRYDESLQGTIVSLIDVAHNEYLNILYHQGVFALAIYAAILLNIATHWIKGSHEDSAIAMLGGAGLCYAVQGVFGFSMCIITPFFWLVLGLLESRVINMKRRTKNAKKTFKPKSGNSSTDFIVASPSHPSRSRHRG